VTAERTRTAAIAAAISAAATLASVVLTWWIWNAQVDEADVELDVWLPNAQQVEAGWTLAVDVNNFGDRAAHGCQTLYQNVDELGLPRWFAPTVMEYGFFTLLPGEAHRSTDTLDLLEYPAAEWLFFEVWARCETEDAVSRSARFIAINLQSGATDLVGIRSPVVPTKDRPWPPGSDSCGDGDRRCPMKPLDEPLVAT
jgi:hypothetical protein